MPCVCPDYRTLMGNHPFSYIGCFFDSVELEDRIAAFRKTPLENPVKWPHVTFAYQPESVDTALFGMPVEVRVVGYGNNGSTEGLRVELHCDNPAIAEMAEGIEAPHVTLSTAEGVEPFETRNLEFKPFDEPFELVGVFGGYRKDEERAVLAPGALA